MATTAMMVEILVIGVVSATWICLLLIRTTVEQPAQLWETMMGKLSGWETATALVAMAFVYQLGWIMNGVCHALTTVLGGKWLRNRVFDSADLCYEEVRAAVYQTASAELLANLGVDRMVARLARAGAINLLTLGVVLMTIPNVPKSIALTAFACAAASACQWVIRHRQYYSRMVDAYKVRELHRPGNPLR